VLTLTRKTGESIIINSNIEVVLLGVQGEQARIGVIAARNIPVYRKEIFEQIQMENLEATRHLNVDTWKNFTRTDA
jgi:carbon storage regulator